MAIDMIEVVSSTMFAALHVFAMYEHNYWIAASMVLSGAVNPFILIRNRNAEAIAVGSGINAKGILLRDTAKTEDLLFSATTCFGFLCPVNVIGIVTGCQTEPDFYTSVPPGLRP
ncbi:hypothetical protein WOLCODRAFT_19887 [Wolfiporia cocos MD-104 SS10]|uniref:Uncharacterized protein n=1 Tax=Wolfiporia cocos (strain MD-104) TaxID=742152 RepID=A0A2H3J0R0_WOLCO|nr:hypothetical protein WOLCODRAFT_19887 [Wolfiporia cocos MD-104 SS10]